MANAADTGFIIPPAPPAYDNRTVPRIFWTPARAMALTYLSAILIGAGLLMLPVSATGNPLGFVDALFTSTSALCVTGLGVVDTAAFFTRTGQAIILLLIEIGGIGILTFATWILMLGGRRPGVLQHTTALMSYGSSRGVPVTRILLYVFASTVSIQAIGFALLFLRLRADFGADAWFHALFHSVSAFCNAGFSTIPGGLVDYIGDPSINLVIMALIILGGLGFLVLGDVAVWLRHFGRTRLTLHSRVVLGMSLWLVAGGALLILLFDWNQGLAGDPWPARLWAALFQSVTARTAGFNTVEIGDLSAPSVFIIIMLMFVGASLGSTGGGIKTTTFAILLSLVRSQSLGNADVELRRRRLPPGDVARALALFSMYTFTLLIGILMMLLAQGVTDSTRGGQNEFLRIFFECVSALGTVGLSMDWTTADLTTSSRLVAIVLMICGRLGPIAIALTFVGRTAGRQFTYPEESVLTG